ncbi:MAG: UbiA family prenyltransferase [Woeseiaceae bacterium]|nr:UbiA family prenyltransferase [Woeseiaceae bacterium]
MANRWWIYQRERFPLVMHGPLVVVFCLAVMLFSSLQQVAGFPGLANLSAAVISTLLLFFQLRVADEFKDFAIDSAYRPHRAVPRGLVSLAELGKLAWAAAAIQLLIAAYLDIGLVPLLFAVWAYMGLMTREFFVKDWLVKHPTVYLLSHMLVMPMIAFYVSAFDWLSHCRAVPSGLGWLLGLSFCSGLVLELGRKVRLPANERPGVETYSALWGVRTAVCVWTAALIASLITYAVAQSYLGLPLTGLLPGAFAALFGFATAFLLLQKSNTANSTGEKFIEPCSGLVALALYLGLGPLQAAIA